MNTTKHNTSQTAKAEALSQAEKEQKTAALLGAFFRGLFYAAVGYLGGILTLPFGATPFGIALLCAAGKQTLFLAIGLFLSTRHLPHPALRLAAFGLGLLFRLSFALIGDSKKGRGLSFRALKRKTSLASFGSRLFAEPLLLRVLNAILVADFLGIMLLLAGGFLFYDLYGLLISMILAPVSVLLFSGLTADPKEGKKATVRYAVAELAIALVMIYAARPLTLYGVSLSPFFALFASLAATKKYGLARGVPASALLGLAVSPSLAPLFALAALGAAVLMPLSVPLASTIALVIGIAYGYSIRGLGVLNGLFPALLAASLLFSMTDKLFLHLGEKRKAAASDEAPADTKTAADICAVPTADALASLQLSQNKQRIKRLCSCFSELSRELADYSARLSSPEQSDYTLVCEEAFRCCCAGCSEYDLCYGEKLRRTREEILRLGGLLQAKERLEKADVARELADRCSRLPDILDEVNHHAALCSSAVERGRKAELFSEDYKGISALVSDMISAESRETEIDLPLSKALAEALTEQSIKFQSVAVIGQNGHLLCLRSKEERLTAKNEEAFRALCRERLPFLLDFERSETVCLSKEPPLYERRIPQKERISVKSAVCFSAADGEGELCGDSAQVFHGEDNRFYACISDGMGSGREAAETSELSGKLLQTLLVGGHPVKGSLTVLNNLLRHRGNGSLHECSATVDLLELDLLQSRALFYKCGAAPTYILREGSLVKLRSGTLPIGIMKKVDVGVVPCEVAPGDVIVMVSDGVTQGKEECPRLFDLLQARAANSSPEQLASLILKDAKQRGSTDDISVAVIRISA